MPSIPALPPAHSSFSTQQQNTNAYYQPIKSEGSYEYKHNFDGAGEDDSKSHPSPSMSRAPRQPQNPPSSSSFSTQAQQAAPAYKNPNPNNIEIKTKFPVARIKRIMQADEEVGKVAQVTPVAVSKALELFMIALVSGAADKAREKGGKRVTAQHLKQVVEADEQFDFLNEIVGKVAEVQESAGGNKRKAKVEDSDESDVEEKKGKKGKGRRRKGDD
jgi:histone H3/H4